MSFSAPPAQEPIYRLVHEIGKYDTTQFKYDFQAISRVFCEYILFVAENEPAENEPLRFSITQSLENRGISNQVIPSTR